jgi:carotenoid cleavage dioxygenase-like enzyme
MCGLRRNSNEGCSNVGANSPDFRFGASTPRNVQRMHVEVVGKLLSTLPDDDDHPYRTGPWRPQTTEWKADDLAVTDGQIPADLDGVYLRNTENPLHPSLKAYHPFDGDGMIHVVGFRDGTAFYRNRFIRTDGLLAENAAAGPLWAGLAERPSLAKRDDGWGARGRMKDASSTDVVVHRGTALTSFYQCGDLYRIEPFSADTLGKETWKGRFPFEWGVSAHPKVDPVTGELLFFNYAKQAPYMHYGVVDENNDLVHYVDIPLPGPRLPHDMAYTRNFAILNDFPLFWDTELLKRDVHAARFHQDMPSRFGVIPRRGRTEDIRWFEARPTYVLHFVNAYEDGDEIVLDGFFQGDPAPADNGAGDTWQRAFRFLALDRMQTRLHRWRLNLASGAVIEAELSDSITEFGMINPGYAGASYRYAYAATGKPSWFLFDGLVKHDLHTGAEERFAFGDGVYGSQTAMAPRVGSAGEDDGYLVTLTTDMNADASHCLIFDAARIADGPVCRCKLPERISSGTHSTWAAGPQLRRWRTIESAPAAVGL